MIETWERAVRPMGRIGHAIEAHASIGSTNDRARALLDEADADGRVVVAEEQSAGRGRRGRAWLSPPGVNLMCSVVVRPEIEARDAWQLGLAAALAAAGACGTVAPVGIKWPNDLVAGNGDKVGGLLTETMTRGDRLSGAVIGIGLNVNWTRESMPRQIAERATSLADLAGGPVDRVALLARLLAALETELAAVEAGESPLERYRAACTTLGTFVTVATPDGTARGRAVGLDPSGALIVEVGDGRTVVSSGEVVTAGREVPA
ncbi:MAG TPA: biotin--[acetyl-CoA-carboxylase] ligase [Candidatus Binatia bacterium]|nr:biotin--[acetyl-CoA-carboxylase] ligase [Candidatus Binatia bacterium]